MNDSRMIAALIASAAAAFTVIAGIAWVVDRAAGHRLAAQADRVAMQAAVAKRELEKRLSLPTCQYEDVPKVRLHGRDRPGWCAHAVDNLSEEVLRTTCAFSKEKLARSLGREPGVTWKAPYQPERLYGYAETDGDVWFRLTPDVDKCVADWSSVAERLSNVLPGCRVVGNELHRIRSKEEAAWTSTEKVLTNGPLGVGCRAP